MTKHKCDWKAVGKFGDTEKRQCSICGRVAWYESKCVSHWLTCPHRGDVLATINGRVAGCGCSSSKVEVYQCNHPAINEPVLIKGHPPCLDTLREKVSGATGRTCRECQVPREQEGKSASHRLPPIELSQSLDRGIITGAAQIHWPCLGALAIAAANQGIGLAVADHGLRPWQREELDKSGVRWVDHERPDLAVAKARHRAASDVKAWWKPWICLGSPFERSAWIDSDAVLVGPAAELFDIAPAVSTEDIWQPDGAKLYRELISRLFGTAADAVLPNIARINSGVLSWCRGEPLLAEWRTWCERLMSDGDLVPLCRVRDQAGLLVAMVERAVNGRMLPRLLGEEWNVPADRLTAKQSKNRKPIRLDPAGMLADATTKHPGARIVHWLGGIKPWTIS